MSLFEAALKKGINRPYPRLIFLPHQLINQKKPSQGFINHYLTRYIPDILIMDVKQTKVYGSK